MFNKKTIPIILMMMVVLSISVYSDETLNDFGIDYATDDNPAYTFYEGIRFIANVSQGSGSSMLLVNVTMEINSGTFLSEFVSLFWNNAGSHVWLSNSTLLYNNLQTAIFNDSVNRTLYHGNEYFLVVSRWDNGQQTLVYDWAPPSVTLPLHNENVTLLGRASDNDGCCEFDLTTDTLTMIKSITVEGIPVIPPSFIPPLNISLFNITNPKSTIFPLTNQVYEYFNGLWKINYNISLDNLTMVNVTIDDSIGNIYLNTSINYFDIYLDSFLFDNQNPINITFYVIDNASQRANISIIFNITDSVNPSCVIPTDAIIIENVSTVYNLTLGCEDESFDLINITCEDYSHYNISLDSLNFTLNDSFIVSVNNSCFINFSDKFDNKGTGTFNITFFPEPTPLVIPPPKENITIIGFGEGSGTGIANYNLIEIIFIGFMIAILLFMMSLGFIHKIAGVIIISSLLLMFLGVFIQYAGFDQFINIIGIGIIFMSVMTFVSGIFIGRSK